MAGEKVARPLSRPRPTRQSRGLARQDPCRPSDKFGKENEQGEKKFHFQAPRKSRRERPSLEDLKKTTYRKYCQDLQPETRKASQRKRIAQATG